MSIARFETLQNAAGSKSVPVATVVDGSAKAWVNFNGTGTVAIRAAFNVSSITDNGTGDYTANFTSAISDSNYCINVSTERGVGSSGFVNVGSYSNSSVRVSTFNSASLADVTSAFIAIFR